MVNLTTWANKGEIFLRRRLSFSLSLLFVILLFIPSHTFANDEITEISSDNSKVYLNQIDETLNIEERSRAVLF